MPAFYWDFRPPSPWPKVRWWKEQIGRGERIRRGLFTIEISRTRTVGEWHWVVYANTENVVLHTHRSHPRKTLVMGIHDALKGGVATSRSRALRAASRVLARRGQWAEIRKEF